MCVAKIQTRVKNSFKIPHAKLVEVLIYLANEFHCSTPSYDVKVTMYLCALPLSATGDNVAAEDEVKMLC